MAITDIDVIYMIAGPSYGKGTQCRKLQERYGFKHVVMSDLLRERGALDGSDNLAPDDIAMEVHAGALSSNTQNLGLLMDGFPRTVAQVDRAVELSKEYGHRIVFLVMEVSDETSVKRLLKRREEMQRAGLSLRPDDDLEIHQERLRGYHARLFQILQRIREIAPLSLRKVSGEESPQEVHRLAVKEIGG